MAMLMAIVVIFNNSSFGISLTSIYYALGIAFLFWIPLMKNSNMKVLSFSMLFLYIAGIVSIIFNNIPIQYKSEQRFLMFVCFTILIGPFIGGNKFTVFRKYLFHYTTIINIFFCSLSFLGLSTGLYRGLARTDFTGLYSHSMLLGPLSGIAILSCLYYFYSTNSKNKKYLLLLCIPLCFLSAVSAGSRSALLSSLAGILFFLYKLYRHHLGKYFQIVSFSLMAGFFTFPLWVDRTTFMMNKIALSEERGDWASSREVLWEQRIMEFKSSPIVGVGFASEGISENEAREFEEDRTDSGKVEPGSSWLAILAMTGILGFVPIMIIFVIDYIFILKSRTHRLWLAYLGGILSIFTLHMFAEGYVFAFGSTLFFLFWLLLGVIQNSMVEII